MQANSVTIRPTRALWIGALALAWLPTAATAVPMDITGFGFSPTGEAGDAIIGIQSLGYQALSRTDADDRWPLPPPDAVPPPSASLLGALWADEFIGDGLPGGRVAIDGNSGFELTASFNSWTGTFQGARPDGNLIFDYSTNNSITMFVEDTSDPNYKPLFDATPNDASLLGVDGGASRPVMTLDVTSGIALIDFSVLDPQTPISGEATIDVRVANAEPGYWWLDSDGDGIADMDVSDLLASGTEITARTTLPFATYNETRSEFDEFQDIDGVELLGFLDLFSQHEAELAFQIDNAPGGGGGGPIGVAEPPSWTLGAVALLFVAWPATRRALRAFSS